MKSFKHYLLLLPIVLSSAALKPYKVTGNGNTYNNKFLAARVILDYKGSATGAGEMDMDLGIEVTIDTLVGVRYEVSFTRKGAVFAHVAIFYKFSNPYQSILYNFFEHKASVIEGGGSKDPDPNVDSIGKESLGAYSCTHLQHGAGTHEISDYWMSQQISGFRELTNSFKKVSADLPGMAFNGTIFKWGGLVKMKIVGTDPKSGKTLNMDLHLQNAKINIPLRLGTFDVPSK
jgi:hypothetical protein